MFEAYAVAVKVSLINEVSSGLMNISRAFAKTHGDAAALQRQLKDIKLLVLGGGALAGTGLFGLHVLGKTMPYAKEYARQLALMNTLGMRQADIAKVVGQAWKTTYDVPTTTAAQNLATFRELRSAFGSDALGQAHAASMLAYVGRLQGVMQSLTGKPSEHVGFDMVKAIELRTGVMTEEALKRNAELMSRAIIGMGGTISVSDFHGALKMGKIASNKLSDDFTYNYLPTLMQELKTAHGGGAQSAGTILMSLYQQVHGRMTKAAMPFWVEGGLIRSGDIVKNASGQWQTRPGAVAGTELFERNPYLWVQQYLGPAVQRIMAKDHVSAETAINAMFSNRNAAFGAYNMYIKAAQYERDKATIGKADGGYAAYQRLLKTDPTLASQALHAQWQNILAQIGFSIMPDLIAGTLKLVGALKDLGQWMHRNPGLVTALTRAFAVLSGTLVISGSILMIAGAIKAVGLAARVFGVMKLFEMARGVTALATATQAAAPASSLAPSIAVGLTNIGVAIAGFAALMANVVVPLAASLAVGREIVHGFKYQGIVKNPRAASALDLNAALAEAKRNQAFYFGELGDKRFNQEAVRHNYLRYSGETQALSAEASRRALVPSGGVQKQSFTGDVHMDGAKVGKVVWRHQAAAQDRAARVGGSAFDPGMALAPAGLGYV